MIIKLLTKLLIICNILVFIIIFQYKGNNWPFDIQFIEAVIAAIVVFIVLIFCQKKSLKSNNAQAKSIKLGLLSGILWTIEISINNIIQPPLPARDIIDNIFWALITLIILFISISSSYKSNKLIDAIKSGFWSGLASGVVACLTGLIYIVFGMKLILSDQLNIDEWSTKMSLKEVPNMSVYFAYETLAGAIMHLIILGVIYGLLLGIIGGLISKIIKITNKNKSIKSL